MGITNCFLFGFDVCSKKKNIYMAGSIKFAKIPIARVVSCCFNRVLVLNMDEV